MTKPSAEEERENKLTVRLIQDNYDFLWDELTKRRKNGRRPNMNSLMNEAVTVWRETLTKGRV